VPGFQPAGRNGEVSMGQAEAWLQHRGQRRQEVPRIATDKQGVETCCKRKTQSSYSTVFS